MALTIALSVLLEIAFSFSFRHHVSLSYSIADLTQQRETTFHHQRKSICKQQLSTFPVSYPTDSYSCCDCCFTNTTSIESVSQLTKSIHCLHFIAQLLNRIYRSFHYSFTFKANKMHCQLSGSSLYFCTFAMNPGSTFCAQH